LNSSRSKERACAAHIGRKLQNFCAMRKIQHIAQIYIGDDSVPAKSCRCGLADSVLLPGLLVLSTIERRSLDVAYWHEADIAKLELHVRFGGKRRHRRLARKD